MADNTSSDSQDLTNASIDLNDLSGLNFGPAWADSNQSKGNKKSGGNINKVRSSVDGAKTHERSSSQRRDRRQKDSSSRNNDRTVYSKDPQGRRRHGGSRHGHGSNGDNFELTVKVDLYPQDEAFEALIKRLQSNNRTYELFEIAHLLLEKPERFVVVVSPIVKNNKQNVPAEDAPLLYYSVPGHLPFNSEEEAMNYVLSNHLELFFNSEEIAIEAPKGNFQMVNKCGVTGELLGPPNYHRYQEFVQFHFTNRINGMSYDRYCSKIEVDKNQESIEAWLEKMKKGFQYTLKEKEDGDPESFDSLESVRQHLLEHRKGKVLGSGKSIRFAGRDIERIPKGNIRRSVEAYIQQQLNFPLDTANNIRGRLRRHKFAVYKKGSKGVSYVCAVKRKFRNCSTVFTDSIQQLIVFLEKNPDIHVSQLANSFLGIDIKKQLPETLHIESISNGQSDEKSNSSSENEGQVNLEESSLPEDTPVVKGVQKDSTGLSAANENKSNISSVDQARLKQTMLDLRWLIMEGYVTEYGNGKIFAPPPMPEPKNKPKEAVSTSKIFQKTAEQPEDKAAPKEKVLKDEMAPISSSEENDSDTVSSDIEPSPTTDNQNESSNIDNGGEVMGLESPPESKV
ncbi:MAG TPA: hypothetical protein DD622_01750 [Opitutae bacterium]|nr:hypothetical protein [Opitutae bacterium]